MSKRLAISIIASLLLSTSLSISQDDNVTNFLANGDFEGEFIELEGAEPRKVAASWTPWHVPATDDSRSFVNHNPNYDEENDRIRLDAQGKAQKYFTLFATHRGGIYQEVDSLTSGATYRFSIYAYVWSSSFEDADLSEDPGDVVLRVGIDPDGGLDGESEDIIWSTAATFFYDAYRQYAVIATAESDSITVFVESTVGEPRANNYIYLDDAVLEVATETVVVVEHTPTQETATALNNETATPNATDAPTASPAPSATDESTAAPAPTEAGPNTESDENNDGQAPTATLAPTATPSPTAQASATPMATATADQDATAEGELVSDAVAETVVHVVVAEDMVSALALQYGSSVAAIKLANGLNASSTIFIGQELIIPLNPSEIAAASAVEEFSAQQAPSPTATAMPTSTATPTLTPTATSTATPTPSATPITYQIQPGDTLFNIALRYGTTVDLLAKANDIANPHQIDVGQVLLIPTAIPPTLAATIRPTVTLYPTDGPTAHPSVTTTESSWYVIYTVQAGDTLDGIAKDNGTTVQAIVDLNGIVNPSRIVPGQEIKIPSPYPTPTLTPTVTPEPTSTPLPTIIPVTYIVQAGDTVYSIAERYGVSFVELAQLNGITTSAQLTVGQELTIPS